ncbi:MAG: 3-hydroxyacyl-CoA dehydrogenase [Sphingomonas bacterium]|uniref:3-hydroxyacyl-CoA dehydrogenase n=1 Tax=Sphingomonas bacterium TaxID=1895847 RepID=UPI00260DE5D1|nr:3-hydroxyacyl-CoA dehydrogenase [Sphingomonas bacterium]MDB5704463.1 3-hydroxyacyl-CoA dehydrogenase [Sphingomonas bacterium]
MMTVIGVIGAGVMGRGIVQLFAQAGHTLRLYDANPDAVTEACTFVAGMIDRQVAKGGVTAEVGAAIAGRIAACSAIADLAGCTMVIEAIVERLDVKQALFAELEAVVDADCILASNTSSLLISAIASKCAHPERVAGLHFFNPVPLMKLAEVIPGVMTAPAVTERLKALVEGAGHRAVAAADQPGFLVNHAGRALYTEGLRVVEEGVTDHVGVDRIVREGMGCRMGPFELLDLTGLDVSGSVMQSIYDQFLQDPRYRPSALIPPRIAAGLYGRKTKRGFYAYPDGQKQEPAEPDVPEARHPVWLGEGVDGALGKLCENFTVVDRSDDPSDPILLLALWGEDVTAAAVRLGLDPTRCVAIDPVTDVARRRTLMKSPVTRPAIVDAAHALLASDGIKVSVIGDSPGFVAQRMLAMIVNTGCEIAQRGIASPDDIDAAVRIGLGYPTGPLALGDRIGAARVLAILESLQRITGDPRYRPSLWLRRRALLGLPLGQQAA